MPKQLKVFTAKTVFLPSLALIDRAYHLPKPGWFLKDDVYKDNTHDRDRDEHIYDSKKD
jgi:hypothetical protein